MVSGRNTITALLILTFSCLVSSDVENFGKTFLEDVTMTVGEKKILDQVCIIINYYKTFLEK